MCGITGFYGLEDKSLIKKMADVIYHRGPDDEGYFIDNTISMANRRLSIIDVSGGKQPISNENDSIWIVSNNEIYNYIQLMEYLEKKGHKFKTVCDTEVILHSYEEWGEECVKKFNGMFAFAIWDSNKKQLFLGRDRFGKKPLYYTFKNGVFLFGSEIKSILQYGEVERKVNIKTLHDFLSFKHGPIDETIFEGILDLPPAHYMVVSKNKSSVKQYWDLFYEEKSYTENFCVMKLRQLLEDSVKIRLMSEVPLGVFLSGGIDSSTIVALVNKYSNSETNTFTVGFGNEREIDELSEARRTSEYYGTNHHELILDEDDYNYLPLLMWHQDQPTGDVTCLPLYRLSEMTKKYATVILTGTGGDEQFVGYDDFKIGLVNHRINKLPKKVRTSISKSINIIPGFERIKRGFTYVLDSDSYQDAILSVKSMFNEEEKQKLYSPETSKRLGNHNIKERYIKYFIFDNPLASMCYFQNKVGLPEDMLQVTDKMTMAKSLEARLPLLDYRMAEFSATIPSRLKIRNLNEKYIFKKTMAKILPREIIKRRKRFFRLPVETFFNKNLSDIANNILTESEIRKKKYFNEKEIERIIFNHKKGIRRSSYQLFNLLAFVTWHRVFIDSENVSKKPHKF
ncbi:asparagine synthase (glutamine-hydrolyzing) [Candidatus Micrarchaeota archaeon RBG_16_49_10]|nr:MAG: asparagine synthase (glutamine-hydrolyzing) [Candidatus Micrarchaeota archaeon RBG_16_49_10]